MGGLGNAALFSFVDSYLKIQSKAPKVSIHIYDRDTVELSNLPRQILFKEADIGLPKAEAAARNIAEFFPQLASSKKLTIIANNLHLDEKLLQTLQFDILIDASDNPEIKYLTNDYCVANDKSYCFGGVLGNEGIAYFRPASTKGSGLRSLFGEENLENAPTCQTAGIIGPVVGTIGAIQGSCALEQIHQGSTEKLYRFDARTKSYSISEFAG